MNSAFGMHWLAGSGLISQVLSTSEHWAVCKTLKIYHFSVNCYWYSSFWNYLFNLCSVCYCKTILFALVWVNSGRYLLSHKAVRKISDTICLPLSYKLRYWHCIVPINLNYQKNYGLNPFMLFLKQNFFSFRLFTLVWIFVLAGFLQVS